MTDLTTKGRHRHDYNGLVFFNIYFPTASGERRVEYKLDFYAAAGYLRRVHAGGKSIIITGDFNTAITRSTGKSERKRNHMDFCPGTRLGEQVSAKWF